GVGIRPGLPLADARAFWPSLAVAEADPRADAALLARLADWCGRWSPFVAVDGADSIGLDVTGCAHLKGGEARLAAEVGSRLGRLGFPARVAIAGTPAAAWAMTHFAAQAVSVVAPGGIRAALAPLPVLSLRLAPAIALQL